MQLAPGTVRLSWLWRPSYRGRRCCGRRPCRRGHRGHVVTVVAAIAVAVIAAVAVAVIVAVAVAVIAAVAIAVIVAVAVAVG